MMADWVCLAIWMGGAFQAYQIERDAGVDRVRAAFEAIFWPVNIGSEIARRWYVSDSEGRK